jgi:HK97 family phage major capsid protein
MEAEISNLTREIERESKLSAIENSLKQPTSSPILNTPNAHLEGKTGRASAEYKTAFWNAMRDKIDVDVKNILRVGTDADGGYLVPDEYEKRLVDGLEEENILRRFANVIQTSSGEKKIPVVASKGSANWIDEGAAIAESDNKFSQITIGAWKLGTAIKVSNELINDSVFDIESYIVGEFARRIGAKVEEAFFTGTGTGQPLGILANTGGAEVGTTTTGATTLTFDDVFDLFHSLKIGYRNKAIFIVNDSTVKNLRKLKDGSGQYLWQASLSAGTPDTLCGRPVYTSAYMPEIGAGKKSILFGDLKHYWIADRQGRIFQRLNELYAPNGQVGYLATQRVDGKLILPEAVKCLQHGGSAN